MKTLGRILIILAVFALVMGITYVVVNAGSAGTSTNAPQFGRSFDDGDRPPFPNGERPEFPGGERGEFREGGGGFGWIFGAIKNVGIVAIIVALIVVPKGRLQKQKRAAQITE